MYAGVSSLLGGSYDSGDVVNGCLKDRARAAAVTTGAVGLRSRRRRALVRLLRLQDHLLQAISLLVRTATLHRLHRGLNVSEPSVCHFCLTARNKTSTTQR